MKRMIAILLAVLLFVFMGTGCGARDTGTVSDSKTGVIEDQPKTDRPVTSEKTSRNDSKNESGFADDMENAMDDMGNAIGDAGRAVKDAVTGQNEPAGAGMTGGR